MTETSEHPQIYLISPRTVDLSQFPNALAQALDVTDVACFRLALSSTDDDRISRVADATRAICHERDIPIVIEHHLLLVERLGLDGVHLTDAARSVRATRTALGADAIVGSFCNVSRHDGMTAGESGADYVSFGPCGASALGDGSQAEPELFQWWSEMIEVPVVAEGALDTNLIRNLAPMTDFFGLGDEIWREDNPAETLKAFSSEMR
ncbi:MAG: thiamine phosphate synthase [Pseudomonadota bacterium]